MSWNYRIMKHDINAKEGLVEFPPYYEIHEVHYDEAGKPNGFTENSVSPIGDSTEELKASIHKMLEAFDKPVLDYDNFPNEVK